MRVVVVDDNEDVRELVAEVLAKAGHEVVAHAHDGWMGVQEALRRRPDLVVTNWRMPVMDGVEATRRIRAAYPSVAIVALSSTGGPELHDAFLDAGADACVDKRDMAGFLAAVRDVERVRGAVA
jgi:CheY-like chemotaxis protein